MKRNYLVLFLVFSIIGCNCSKGNGSVGENVIVSKIHHKKNSSETDTLWVSQNDTTVFRQEEVMLNRPCSNPELQVIYELRNPKDNAYYFIYNNKKQLITAGKYTASYTYDGVIYERGGFYNSKSYSYKKNGDLETIHYQEDGRNLKTEHFDGNNQLTKIRYIDKKSESTSKIEIYKKGQLKETRVYTSFDVYHTVKAND